RPATVASRTMRTLALLFLLAAGLGRAATEQEALPAKKLRMAYTTGPLLKFQIW
uniref:Uncharacterized protein n=1 Tax=Chelydra serpentina TaxID=8475 RepID=A0A8C3SXT1_CHESE